MPIHDILTSSVALLMIVGLIFCVRPLMKKLEQRTSNRRNGARNLEIQERVAVDRARSLLLVRCKGQDILLLIGGNADVMIPCGERQAFEQILAAEESGS